MAIKLIKACKELNIGIATLTAWCERNGYCVGHDPNYRLSDELFAHLAKAFHTKRSLKNEERTKNLPFVDDLMHFTESDIGAFNRNGDVIIGM